MKRIEIDREKCIGCLTCVCACMVSHQEPDARNRVVIDSKNKPAPIFLQALRQTGMYIYLHDGRYAEKHRKWACGV